jgi:phage terminase large subunit-like protein
MEGDRPQMRRDRLLTCIKAGILFLTIVVSLTVPAFADDSVTVSCYTDAGYLDDVDDVANVTQAAQLCNSTYTACAGRCIGCFHDFDYDENVCVDNQGRQFVR